MVLPFTKYPQYPPYISRRFAWFLIALALFNALLSLWFVARMGQAEGGRFTPFARLLGWTLSVLVSLWVPFFMGLVAGYNLRPTEPFRLWLRQLAIASFPLAGGVFFLLLDPDLPMITGTGALGIMLDALGFIESSTDLFLASSAMERFMESAVTSIILAGFGVLVYLHASPSRRIPRMAAVFLYPFFILFGLAHPLAIVIMLMCIE